MGPMTGADQPGFAGMPLAVIYQLVCSSPTSSSSGPAQTSSSAPSCRRLQRLCVSERQVGKPTWQPANRTIGAHTPVMACRHCRVESLPRCRSGGDHDRVESGRANRLPASAKDRRSGSMPAWGEGAASPVRAVPVPVTLPLAEMVERLNTLQPQLLYGYPSMLARLA